MIYQHFLSLKILNFAASIRYKSNDSLDGLLAKTLVLKASETNIAHQISNKEKVTN